MFTSKGFRDFERRSPFSTLNNQQPNTEIQGAGKDILEMSSEEMPPVPMRPQRHTGSPSPTPPIPMKRPNRVRTSDLNDLMQDTDDQLNEMQSVIQGRSNDSKSNSKQLKDQEENLQRGKEDLLGTSETEFELQEEKERLLEKKETELKERRKQQEDREKELELLERRKKELMKEKEREAEQELKRQRELELEDQRQKELEEKQELELEAKRRELELLEREQLLAKEKSAKVQKSKRELEPESKQEDTKETDSVDVASEITGKDAGVKDEDLEIPLMPERPKKLHSPTDSESDFKDEHESELEMQQPKVPGKRPPSVGRRLTGTPSIPEKRPESLEKKLSQSPVMPKNRPESLEKKLSNESYVPSDEKPDDLDKDYSSVSPSSMQNESDADKVEPFNDSYVESQQKPESLEKESTEPSKILEESPKSLEAKSSAEFSASPKKESSAEPLVRESSDLSQELKENPIVEDKHELSSRGPSVPREDPSVSERKPNSDEKTREASLESTKQTSDKPSVTEKHQDKSKEEDNDAKFSTAAGEPEFQESKTTVETKPQEDRSSKPGEPMNEPLKKKAPPVPKKPSSRIVAFQEMLRKQQMEDVKGSQHQEPEPVREETKERSDNSQPVESSVSPEASQASPQPAVPQRPTRQPISAERSKFANNLNGIFALPGMSPMGGLPPSFAKKLGPSSSTPSQDEKKEASTPSSVSDVRSSRARGPRGRKLPSNVASVEKVNSESKTNEIEIFRTWKTVVSKKEEPMVPERPSRVSKKGIESGEEKSVEVTDPTHFDLDNNKAVKPIEVTENPRDSYATFHGAEYGSEVFNEGLEKTEEDPKDSKTSKDPSDFEGPQESDTQTENGLVPENTLKNDGEEGPVVPERPSRPSKHKNESAIFQHSSESLDHELLAEESLKTDELSKQEEPAVPERPSKHEELSNIADKEPPELKPPKQEQSGYGKETDFPTNSSRSSEAIPQTTFAFADSQKDSKDSSKVDLLSTFRDTSESKLQDSNSELDKVAGNSNFDEELEENLGKDDKNE